jgi:hypothetical protein
MMQLEPNPSERVRVIGALTGPPLEMLLEMVGSAELLLDLSEVREADADAVHLLAHLAPEQWTLLACPKWLALRVEMERRPQPSAAGVGNVA